jgi:hypothetical protein
MEMGAPAIQPRSDAIPTFTEQDVRDYLGSLLGGRIILHGQPTITQIVFTTIHDLGRAIDDGTWEGNYPADLAICYVELSGHLQFLGVGSRFPQGEGNTAFLLFDARTGRHCSTGRLRALIGTERHDDGATQPAAWMSK